MNEAPVAPTEPTEVWTFSEFYETHYQAVARALSVTLGDAGMGREATDEAMTRAYERWDVVGSYTNPSGWVYRVGLNWARSLHRRLSRRLPWTTPIVELPHVPNTDLSDALGELDMKYRAVVVCRYLLDYSTDQTAEALNLAPGTVKSRLRAGLAKLRAELGVVEP